MFSGKVPSRMGSRSKRRPLGEGRERRSGPSLQWRVYFGRDYRGDLLNRKEKDVKYYGKGSSVSQYIKQTKKVLDVR